MCLWASSPSVAFLQGRFLWVNWKVDELVAMKERLDREPGLLRLGINGFDPASTFADVVQKTNSVGEAWLMMDASTTIHLNSRFRQSL